MGQFVVARPGEEVGSIHVPEHVAHAAKPGITGSHHKHSD